MKWLGKWFHKCDFELIQFTRERGVYKRGEHLWDEVLHGEYGMCKICGLEYAYTIDDKGKKEILSPEWVKKELSKKE